MDNKYGLKNSAPCPADELISSARWQLFDTGSSGLLPWYLSPDEGRAHASLFHGETLDSIANGISWVVLVIAPIIGIAVFWLLHVMPEKIAEKKKHPQTHAIHCLCLLSLFFGGLLWPIAWLWAYTKPVLHKMAYGTDVDESLGHHERGAR